MKLNTMQEHQHSDSILLKEAIQFLTGKRCQVNLYLDSSAARGRKLRVCSLLFSATSGISEGLCSGKVSGTGVGTVQQPSLGTVMFQDRMSADTSECICIRTGRHVHRHERMCIRSRNSLYMLSGTPSASADALLVQGPRPGCTGTLREP